MFLGSDVIFRPAGQTRKRAISAHQAGRDLVIVPQLGEFSAIKDTELQHTATIRGAELPAAVTLPTHAYMLFAGLRVSNFFPSKALRARSNRRFWTECLIQIVGGQRRR
jgi:hypothetical protein